MDQQQQQFQEDQLSNEQQISPSSSDLDQESSYQQKPAFLIPPDIDNADPEQLAAFNYLMNVRKQAKSIKDEDKRKKILCKKVLFQNLGTEQKQNPAKMMSERNQQDQWFNIWSSQMIKNWKCVVENVKFLQKKKIYTEEKGKIQIWKKQSRQILSEKPRIFELYHVQLGRIQQLISGLSEQYYTSGGKNYYIWIYSLLAIHRSLASYSIFEALASINSCILQQNRVSVETLVVTCILSKQFMQTGLEKLEKKLISQIEEVY